VNTSKKYAKDCEQCEGTFMTARSHARFCGKTCRDNAARDRSRERKRQGTIESLGAKCRDCSEVAGLFIREGEDGQYLLCGKCRVARLPKPLVMITRGGPVFVKRGVMERWAQEYLNDLPDDEERNRFLSQFK
jgi:hypothetical protein